MELTESDEQQLLRESIRGVVERDASLSQVRAWVLEAEPDHAAAHALAVRQGWTGVGIPEALGGQGGGTLELAILAEELGRGAVPADALYASLLAGLLMSRVDGPAAQELVEGFAAGTASGAVLRSAGHPLDAAMRAGAPIGLVLGAPGADGLIALGSEGAALVEAEAVEVQRAAMLDRTRSLGDVAAHGDGRPLGTVDGEVRGWLAAHAAVIAASDALGACQRMLDLTVEYVSERVQFGVPVGSFQAVKHAAAELLAAIEGTRAVVQYAAWATGIEAAGYPIDAWVAKSRASRAAQRVADGALFLHGAVGYTWEHDLQLLFKRAKSDAELFGAAVIYEDRIADALELVEA